MNKKRRVHLLTVRFPEKNGLSTKLKKGFVHATEPKNGFEN